MIRVISTSRASFITIHSNMRRTLADTSAFSITGRLAAQLPVKRALTSVTVPWENRSGIPTRHRIGLCAIRQFHAFASPVPYADPTGRFYETTYSSRTAFTGRSVRPIAPNDFFRILAVAGVIGDPFASLPDTELAVAGGYSALAISTPPRQPFREISEIPPGTGYRPTGRRVDVFESAALQERARRDHQQTLRVLQRLVHQRGGHAFLNNNVDLFATVRGERLLVEAKSITEPRVVVDRMRYGIGQLADYAIRYRVELGEAMRTLAFGAIPPPEAAWISTILEESRIAFVALDHTLDRVVPLNDRARSLPLFDS